MKVILAGPGFDNDDVTTVIPIDDVPEFEVDCKRISNQKTSRILDLNQLNKTDPQFASTYKATCEIAKAMIIGWRGEEAIFGRATPCIDDNKELLVASRLVIRDATEDKPAIYETIFSRVQKKLEDKHAKELKN
jgi:hypothetical protein